MQEPLVSVIMASYNNAKLLPESIRSILGQTYKNIEFIVSDDGSKDNSPKIISDFAFKDRRILPILSTINEGAAKSRNKAVRKATGKYLAIVDSDDICLPTRFAQQVKYMENHPEVGVLGTNWYIFSSNSKKSIKAHHSDNDIKLGIVPVHNPTTLIRKEVFDKYGMYDPHVMFCEDIELFFRWYGKGVKFANLDKYLTKYRIAHGNNTGEGIKAYLYWQLFKLNLIAIFRYKIRFSLSGYIHTIELFFYWVYCYLGLNKVYMLNKGRQFG